MISKVHYWDTGVRSKFYYLYDHLGNTRAIVDEYGNIVNVYYYDVFGRCWNNTWDKANEYQFVGGYGVSVEIGLAGVGLMYMRNRYYDASTGRFLSRDVFKGFLDTPITLNLYIYSRNNSINMIDPFGLSEIPLAPPNVDIYKNIEMARKMNKFDWIMMVRPGGLWDYKRYARSYKVYQDFGNFNYGATGRAVGFSREELLMAAGFVSILQKPTRIFLYGIPFFIPPYGDDPIDQEWILRGIIWYERNWGK